MAKFTTANNYHAKVVEEVFDQSLADDDAMLVMALLHTYCFRLPGPILRGASSTRSMAAITQRHAAECLCRIWRGTTNPRSDYTFWYWAWNGEWGSYERLESLTSAERTRLGTLKNQIEQHEAVAELVPEDDWELISGSS